MACGNQSQTVELWNVETGKKRCPLVDHKHNVIAVAFAPGGKTLASASVDGTVKLWDFGTGDTLATIRWRGDLVAFSPDGKLLASPCNEVVKLWDLDMGLERLIFEK